MSRPKPCARCVASGQLIRKERCLVCDPLAPWERPLSDEELSRQWEVSTISDSKKKRDGSILYQVGFVPTYELDPDNHPWYDRMLRKSRPDDSGGSVCYWMDEWLPKENIHPDLVKEFLNRPIKKRRKRKRKY